MSKVVNKKTTTMNTVGNNSVEKRKKKIHKEGFAIYVRRVLKQVHPDTNMTKNSCNQMNRLMILLAKTIAETARAAIINKKQVTITSREIQYAIRTLLPGELLKHAVSEGTKAVTKFNAHKINEDENKAKGPYTIERDGKKVPVKKAFGGVKGKYLTQLPIKHGPVLHFLPPDVESI